MARREPEYLSLTTTGWRTGLPREIEIWFTRWAGRYHVIAEHGERARWVRNLRAEPRARIRVGRVQRAVVGQVLAETSPLVDAVRRRSEAKYGWGDGLVVELRPVVSPRAPSARAPGRGTPGRSRAGAGRRPGRSTRDRR